MAAYLISYDLNKKDKNYDGVYQAIKNSSDGTWCHPLESTWLIRTSLTVEQVSDNIQKQIDSNDMFLVIEVKKNYQGFLTEEMWKYLRENIFA